LHSNGGTRLNSIGRGAGDNAVTADCRPENRHRVRAE
jgi:hypothetical protein